MANVAAIVIGRNEGERFLRCLSSLRGQVGRAVYVDSGSTDGSVAAAQSEGVLVVQLGLERPFTAARARNAGFAALGSEVPEFLQFVDGDCEIYPGWIEASLDFLHAHPDVAVVCGRRRERFPNVSAYNRLCDWEWDTPVGEALTCGGDALIRSKAFVAVGGYDATLIAGEEPEMCWRLRAAGWRVWRIGIEMSLHDAALLRFGQWWQRAQRGGFAAAQGLAMYGGPAQRKQVQRALVWGLGLPLLLIAGLVATHWAVILVLVWPLQVVRLAWRFARDAPTEGISISEAWERAGLLTLGKFPELMGVVRFWLSNILGKQVKIIEYK